MGLCDRLNDSYTLLVVEKMYELHLKKAIAYYEKSMLINHYPCVVTRLLFQYRKDSDFHKKKFMEWLRHAAVNAVEIDRELLGLSVGTNDSFFNKLFKTSLTIAIWWGMELPMATIDVYTETESRH